MLPSKGLMLESLHWNTELEDYGSKVVSSWGFLI